MNIKNNILVLLLFFALMHCKREEASWHTEYFGPIAKTTLRLDNIVEDSLINVNSDSSITIIYKQNLLEVSTDSLIGINEVEVTDTVHSGFAFDLTIFAGQTITTNSENIQIEIDDARISTLKIKKGKIKYKVESPVTEPNTVIYQIQNSELPDGSIFTETVDLPAANTGSTIIVNGEIPIENLLIDMSDNNTSYNILKTNVQLALQTNANQYVYRTTDKIVVTLSLAEIELDYAFGYFGNQQSQNIDDSDFDIFNRIINGSVDIDDIDISLDIVNYVGTDAQVKFNSISGVNSRNNQNITLSHSSIGNAINLNRASLNGNQITQTEYNIQMNPQNSNVDLFFENLPNVINSNYEYEINPLGNISNSNDFLFGNKVIEANLTAELPLRLIANNFHLVDTLDIDIDSDNILHSANLQLIIDNYFPLSATVQLYILDGNNSPSDTLVVQPNFISAASTNVNNLVIQSSQTILDVVIDETAFNNLKESKKIIVSVVFNTPSNNTMTTIYQHHKMEIKMIGDITLEPRI